MANKKNTTIKNYNKFYSEIKDEIYPQEWIVRIFSGNYPNLDIPKPLTDKEIVEISCGDGRNLIPLINKKMNVSATEVTNQIVSKLKNKYPLIKFIKGINGNLPFKNDKFDILISWNSMYYMGQDENSLLFDCYVKEFARILKKGGTLIGCVPMKTNFIYKKSYRINSKYRLIKEDPFGGIRNGEILRCFQSEKDIISEFEKYFTNFTFAYSKIDHFGIQNDHYIFICKKK